MKDINHSSQYALILERVVKAYNELIVLYTPEQGAGNRFADIAISEAKTKRNGLLERLADPATLEEVFICNYFLSISHFLDDHWDDYHEYPVANPEKFKKREELHAELESVKQDIMRIQNSLLSNT